VAAPSPEVAIENLRRTLHASIAYYASLAPDALDGDVEDDLVELTFILGMEWVADVKNGSGYQTRLRRILISLCEAAREDQLNTLQRRQTALAEGRPEEPAATAAVDRWLDRWLSGREANRLP